MGRRTVCRVLSRQRRRRRTLARTSRLLRSRDSWANGELLAPCKRLPACALVRRSAPVRQIVQPDEHGTHEGPEKLTPDQRQDFVRFKSPSTTPAKGPTGLMKPGPPNLRAVNTPAMTATPQPAVTTIQPPFWAFDRLSRTPATTPSPNRIRTIVPSSSPWNPFKIASSRVSVCKLGTKPRSESVGTGCSLKFGPL